MTERNPSAPITAPDAGIVLAAPRGFCAGVDRAIDIVERALEKFGRPIYVRHEIVHMHSDQHSWKLRNRKL